MTLPTVTPQINTLKLFFTHGVDFIPVVDVGVLNIVKKMNWRLHLFGDLKGDLASVAYGGVLFGRI